MHIRRLVAAAVIWGAPLLVVAPVEAQIDAEADARAAVPVLSRTGPDGAAYGEEQGYPVGHPLKRQQNMVGNYSHADQLFPSHRVAAAAQPSALARAPKELSLTYRFQGKIFSLQDYLDRNPATGLLIARDDMVLFEHYQYGRTDRDRFYSQSMAKTITAMLVGVALEEGVLRSIDDTVQDHIPELAGTELGVTPLRALLHMASGLDFSQDYGGSDDGARLNALLFAASGPDTAAILSQFNTRVAAPGTVWHYANLNTETLGLVLSRATRMTVAQYLESRIWQPMGAEADAAWITDHGGQEISFCCFNATLRDYARFALMLAHDGEWNGRQIVPRQWVLDGTQPVAEGSYLAVEAGPHPWGYGYQMWLMPGPRRTFALEGIEGQRIFIDPATRLVLVHTAVRLKPTHDAGDTELLALWRSLLRSVDPVQPGRRSPS